MPGTLQPLDFLAQLRVLPCQSADQSDQLFPVEIFQCRFGGTSACSCASSIRICTGAIKHFFIPMFGSPPLINYYGPLRLANNCCASGTPTNDEISRRI